MLRLQKATVADILTHAAQATGLEVVGLVWQTSGPNDAPVQVVRRLRNVHSQPDKYYSVSPAELMRAYRDMDQEGGEPLAFYHSHPGGKPDPSEEDMLGAMNVGMHYLIAHPTRTEMKVMGRADPIVVTGIPWRLSAWECISPQILVGAELDIS